MMDYVFYFNWVLLIIFQILIIYDFYRFSHNKRAINNLISLSILIVVYAFLMYLLLRMRENITIASFILPLWLLVLNISILCLFLIVLISTFASILYKKYFDTSETRIHSFILKKQNKIRNASKLKRDSLRKLNHALLFCAMLVFFIVFGLLLKPFPEFFNFVFNSESNSLYLFSNFIVKTIDVESFLINLGGLRSIFYIFFYIFLLLMLFNEISRKSKLYKCPFNFLANMVLSEEEIKEYGSYLYFAVGHIFASLFCPPIILYAILGMSTISDLASSQVGIRFGRYKIQWNSQKSWEGTIAGTLVCFLLCFLISGPIWSSIFTILFFIIDISTGDPIDVSDNLLIPFTGTLIYIIMSAFLTISCDSLFLALI
ncbi:MAG: hypothetical protein GF317_25055 [Candidatus Lokiarchaeota archaeon]|nr:hypothetical protein [Candidatus Lokiarchaeota archaeon]MBD3202628.1 hypothetical protein [Candidatus Lokiarchaeota archaeon]